MYLPAPTHSFSIPSVHDGTELECRVYLPVDRHNHSHIQGAIVAHPYAPLGGCYDDPVVGFVGGELLRCGYIIGTFNFRGAGESRGRTSWTGRPELADYVSFYGFMLHFLHRLIHEPEANGSNLARSNDSEGKIQGPSPGVDLILGGYSYGSLIASHLPALNTVVNLFSDSGRATLFDDIRHTAVRLAMESLSDATPIAKEVTTEEMTKTTISYLLVSPLLSPVNLLLTLFSDISLDIRETTSAQKKQIPCPNPTDQLTSHSTLALYGNQDTFTSAHKLRKWCEDLSQARDSTFQSAEIDQAGHFWRERGVEAQAREALRKWLLTIS